MGTICCLENFADMIRWGGCWKSRLLAVRREAGAGARQQGWSRSCQQVTRNSKLGRSMDLIVVLFFEMFVNGWEEQSVGNQKGGWQTGQKISQCYLASVLGFLFVLEIFSIHLTMHCIPYGQSYISSLYCNVCENNFKMRRSS